MPGETPLMGAIHSRFRHYSWESVPRNAPTSNYSSEKNKRLMQDTSRLEYSYSYHITQYLLLPS